MGLNIDYLEGQPPLDEDEKEGLLIPTIATREELDEFEQQNIEQAVLWSLNRSFKADTVFSEAFVGNLHKRMYGHVWKWAGTFRKSNKNIGVDKWQIPTDTSIAHVSDTAQQECSLVRTTPRPISFSSVVPPSPLAFSFIYQ